VSFVVTSRKKRAVTTPVRRRAQFHRAGWAHGPSSFPMRLSASYAPQRARRIATPGPAPGAHPRIGDVHGVSIVGHGHGGAGALPRGMGCVAPVYRPRDAEHTVLHQVIAENLEAFLGAVTEAGDGAGLPQFVEREFREFLLCGVYEAGVARFQCEGCAREHL